ncbi:MAG: Gfo/Idh/MocA family oxidoreductase [Clostridia bacterium]|nr:Gfo/Idh/MocA family oxidoreductase [Clostridia bacterium]
MKYAVIGTSWITAAFIEAAKFAGAGAPYAVYSRNAQKGELFARENGIEKVYTQLEQLADDEEIGAVYIASPNALHYSQSRLMLLSGKNVICEKPLAVKSAEIRELISLSKEKGLVYMEAIMFLYMPQLDELKNAVKKIGTVSSADIDFSQLSSKYPLLINGENPNIFNPELCTGCLMDIGVYNVYFALELFGVPDKITSSAHFIFTGADSTGAAIFDYPDKQVTLTYSKVGQSRSCSQIFGDRGTVLIPSVSQLGEIQTVYNDLTAEKVCREISRTEIMSYEAAAFFSFINGENPSRLDYAQQMSVKVCECMEKIRRQNNGFKF